MAFSRTAAASLLAELLFVSAHASAQVAAQPPSVPAPETAKPKPAAAKETSAQAPAAPATELSTDATVTVVGNRQSNRIDRQVYDVSTDVAASASTASDALNKVPSVSVSPDGTVTLRGSTNVQILIDGKPSAMMQGETRGTVLNSLPAEDIQSIEVVNNPGAQFGNEGGGGPILNLVMRRQRPGAFGSVNANAGSEGRRNGSVFGNVTTGAFGVQGSAYASDNRSDSTGAFERERFEPASGLLRSRDTQAYLSHADSQAAGLNTTLTYHINDKDVLAAGLGYLKSTSASQGQAHYVSVGADDHVFSDYLRTSQVRNTMENFNGNIRFDHKGELPNEKLTLDLRLSASDRRGQNAYANHYTVTPARPGVPQSRQDSQPGTRIADFTGDYERPTERGTLKLGYKLAGNRNVLDVRYLDIDPATLAETVNPARTNRFVLDELTAALWSSYEWRLDEKWGVMGGLRAEYTDMRMDQVTTRTEVRNDYLNAIPSFYLRYYLSENTTLRFSYAHRIRRPNASELNPFVNYIDELNVSSGNPALKPSNTDSFELGYESRLGVLNTNVRAYYRRDADVILPRQLFIDNNVLLTTRANAGDNRSGGLEFTLNGKLLPALTINTSGNLAYVEQNALVGALGGDSKHTTSSLSGRAMVNYELAKTDHLQLVLNAQGKTLMGQGVRKGWQTADLDYRRKLTDGLNLVLKAQDVFDSRKVESFTDTALLKDHSLTRFGGRVFFVGLSYRLGGFGAPAGRPAQPAAPMTRPVSAAVPSPNPA
jgi:outer membrane receptor protein involved in Fe transport